MGPCITSVIDLRNQPVLEDGMVIEDGNIPGPLASTITPSMISIAKLFGHEPDGTLAEKNATQTQKKLKA